MKEYIRTSYKDQKIVFLLEMLKRVEYLRDVAEEILYEIMFSLAPRQFEKDSIVLQEDANAGSVQFLEQGVIEVFTQFEQNDFILEKLYKGSVIN